MKLIYQSLLFCLLPLICSANETAEKIAQRYGIQNWDKVESISYTFNVKTPKKETARRWTWEPKTGQVTSHADKITYNRKDAAKIKANRTFVNDSYWLLYPFQIIWDQGLSFEDVAEVKDPITGASSKKLRCIHNSADGYTPGDVYELFYNEDYEITAWTFLRKGKGKPNHMSWENNRNFKGITISTEHNSPKGTRLFFTDIVVKLSGE